MPWLLVDNSNTRTKFALANAETLLEARAWLPTTDISPARLEEELAGFEFEGTLLCSVVPERARVLRDHLVKHGPVHPLTWRSQMGLDIDYPNPEQIGADRLANAIGVAARHGAPAIVIDFGTAVTFDVVSAGPAYCGGVIAPVATLCSRA